LNALIVVVAVKLVAFVIDERRIPTYNGAFVTGVIHNLQLY
jgi:hypothetical protein